VLAVLAVLARVLILFQVLIRFYWQHLLGQLQEMLLRLAAVMAQCLTLPQPVVLAVLAVAALAVLRQAQQEMVALVFLVKEMLAAMG
jgi:hypothetical protein